MSDSLDRVSLQPDLRRKLPDSRNGCLKTSHDISCFFSCGFSGFPSSIRLRFSPVPVESAHSTTPSGDFHESPDGVDLLDVASFFRKAGRSLLRTALECAFKASRRKVGTIFLQKAMRHEDVYSVARFMKNRATL